MDNILTRRSIRRYTDEPISKEDIEKLMRAAMAAPSAKNAQPWEFIIVQDKEKLQKMSRLTPYARPLMNAPLGIVVLGNLEVNEFLEYCMIDASAATENLLLAAHEMGLGGVWIGMYPKPANFEKFNELFNVPEHVQPLWMIALGHPSGEGVIIDKYNETKIHFEDWGNHYE